MELKTAKQKFINTWGKMSSSWGVPKSMAQMHALLLISPRALDVQQITEALSISMGNANTNLRKLIEWKLIYKKKMKNKRKDYYLAEKDMWTIFSRILEKRKKEELDPIAQTLDELMEVSCSCHDSKEFCRVIRSLKQFTNLTDSALDYIIQSDSDWIIKSWDKIIR